MRGGVLERSRSRGLGDGQGEGERVQRRDEQQGLAAEGEAGVAGAGLHVARGERDDLGGGLGVEQDQPGRGAVFGAGSSRLIALSTARSSHDILGRRLVRRSTATS